MRTRKLPAAKLRGSGIFNDPNDRIALDILADLFPDHVRALVLDGAVDSAGLGALMLGLVAGVPYAAAQW